MNTFPLRTPPLASIGEVLKKISVPKRKSRKDYWWNHLQLNHDSGFWQNYTGGENARASLLKNKVPMQEETAL